MGSQQAKAQYVQDRTAKKRNGSTGKTTLSATRKPNTGGPGGWTEQDLTNAQTLEDAKQLAVVSTKDIMRDVDLKGIDLSTIDVSYLQSQVVNGLNYRLEYSIKDKDGDNIMWVTALLWKPAGQPPSRAQVVQSDYNIENINIQGNSNNSADRGRTR